MAAGRLAIDTTITPPNSWRDLNLREVWDHRELQYFFVWRDLKVRYKQTAIGAIRAILHGRRPDWISLTYY